MSAILTFAVRICYGALSAVMAHESVAVVSKQLNRRTSCLHRGADPTLWWNCIWISPEI